MGGGRLCRGEAGTRWSGELGNLINTRVPGVFPVSGRKKGACEQTDWVAGRSIYISSFCDTLPGVRL